MGLYVSYTDFKNYRNCPHRYFLEKILRKPVGPQNTRNFLVGGVVHDLMDRWFRTGRSEGYMEKFAPVMFDAAAKDPNIEWRGPNDREELRERAVDYARRTEEILFERGFDSKKVLTEVWIRARLPRMEHVEIGGRADIILPEEGNTVVDLKVTKDKKYLDFDQLLFYDMAYSIQIRRKVQTVAQLVPLMGEGMIETSFETAHWQEMYRELKAMAEAVTTKRAGSDFAATGVENNSCFFCPVKRHCHRHVPQDVEVVQTERGNKRASF